MPGEEDHMDTESDGWIDELLVRRIRLAGYLALLAIDRPGVLGLSIGCVGDSSPANLPAAS